MEIVCKYTVQYTEVVFKFIINFPISFSILYTIYFREMPTKDEKQLAEDTWLLRNPGKPLPNTNAAKAAYQRLRAREQKSADEKLTKREARLALKK